MAIKTYYLLKRYKDTAERNVPFYVENLTSTAATLTLTTSFSDATNIEYSTDNSTWSSTQPSVPANGRVYIRANATGWNLDEMPITIINCDRQFNVGGNTMSLLYGSSFTGTEISFPDTTKNGIFVRMFANATNLVSAEKLALPAMTLANSCYYSMFFSCSALTDSPALPATTLAAGCYSAMFGYCTALTTAPELPATTLATGCYEGMFNNCSNLNSITVGATSWDTSNSSGWVSGVSATGTFKKPTNTSIPTNADGIPSGWTVINV